ncbi:MAG: kynureninase [Gammaproteobacteria bacterium]
MAVVTAFLPTAEYAAQLDSQDILASYGEQFYYPLTEQGERVIYLAGHSLGLAPKKSQLAVNVAMEQWQEKGVRGHFEGKTPWVHYHETLTPAMAQLVGAKPEEVIVMNGLTVNIHLLMVSFYRPTSKRYKILMEAQAFPSDIYAVKSQLHYHGFDPDDALVVVKPAAGKDIIDIEQWREALADHGDSVAFVWVGQVNYLTGQRFDIEAICQATHHVGALLGVDCAHGVGNVPLQLHQWNVDCAAWCCYKYLNGGPGTVGAAFIHERHLKEKNLPRFSGWWGHDKHHRFQMSPEFNPMATAEGWQLSNPPIFQMAALRASLDIFDEVGMVALRKKSEKLTGYLYYLLQERKDIEILTPADPQQRGCQLSVRINKRQQHNIEEQCWNVGMVVDFRPPDVIRVAPVPLYTRFSDVYTFSQRLSEVL